MRVLDGLPGVTQIKDNLVVHGSGREHDERLKKVFERFPEAGLTLRKEQCKLGKQEVVWFGNVYNRQGMNPESGPGESEDNQSLAGSNRQSRSQIISSDLPVLQ